MCKSEAGQRSAREVEVGKGEAKKGREGLGRDEVRHNVFFQFSYADSKKTEAIGQVC